MKKAIWAERNKMSSCLPVNWWNTVNQQGPAPFPQK